jgi:hypothetical protein
MKRASPPSPYDFARTTKCFRNFTTGFYRGGSPRLFNSSASRANQGRDFSSGVIFAGFSEGKRLERCWIPFRSRVKWQRVLKAVPRRFEHLLLVL